MCRRAWHADAVAFDSGSVPFDAPAATQASEDGAPLVAGGPIFPSPADRLIPPRDRDVTLVWRIVGIVVVGVCCGLVLMVLEPRLLLRNTTPNGGDLGAHVWFPAYLRDHLLPHWRVAGWSNDWFGGFPAGQFYFPLPALVTVVLDVFLPYNVALKLTTAIGPVAIPAAAYAFGRGLKMRRPAPEFCAVASLFFLYFQGISTGANAAADQTAIQFNQRIMGGTLVSALAGEYSFSMALALALFALGALGYSTRTGRRSWLAAVLLAATVLSHVVVGLFAIVGAVVIVGIGFTRRYLRARRVLGRASAIGLVAGLLTAFWSLPLIATFPYTANMRYTKITAYIDYLIVDEFLWAYVLAIVGLALAIAFRDRAALTVAVLGLIFAGVFRFWPELHAWNLRFLPFWYFCVFLMAAIGAAEIVRRLSGELARLWVGPPPLPNEVYESLGVRDGRRYRLAMNATIVVVVAVVLSVGTWFNHSHQGFIPYWARWNETGYENGTDHYDATSKGKSLKQYGEYRALMDRLGRLPAGRALWEGGGSIDNYGTSLALMLIPYWTHGRIGSFEGLYYESAASTPYAFMTIASLSGAGNSSDPVRGLDYRHLEGFSDGVRQLRALGGRYYLAHSEGAKAAAAKDPGLRFIDTVADRDGMEPESWNIYEVRDHALVAPLRQEPIIVTSKSGTQAECFHHAKGGDPGPEIADPWECTSAYWWSQPANLDRPLAAAGPKTWRRSSAADAPGIPRRRQPAVAVSAIHESDAAIRFRVSRVGVPVVVRTSYFPNWEAHGAKGPWRLTPNLMVVIPTSRSVELRFARTDAEKLGGLLSLAGIVGLGGLVEWDRRWRRRRARSDRDVGKTP